MDQVKKGRTSFVTALIDSPIRPGRYAPIPLFCRLLFVDMVGLVEQERPNAAHNNLNFTWASRPLSSVARRREIALFNYHTS